MDKRKKKEVKAGQSVSTDAAQPAATSGALTNNSGAPDDKLAPAPQESDFRAKTTLRQDAISKVIAFIKDQKNLFDAFLVALSFHVVMFPVLWMVGWALPWPKPPVVTTIIDFDLSEWMKTGKPKRIFEFRDPELNQ